MMNSPEMQVVKRYLRAAENGAAYARAHLAYALANDLDQHAQHWSERVKKAEHELIGWQRAYRLLTGQDDGDH